MALTAVLALVAIAAALVFVVVTGQVPAATRAVLEWGLERALDVPVEVGRTRGSLLGRLRVSEVVVGPPDAPRLRVDAVQLALGEPDLERRHLVVESLVVEGLSLSVRQREDGAWEVAGFALPAGDEDAESETGEASGISVSLRELVVRDAALDVRWAGTEDGGVARGRVDLALENVRVPATPEESWPDAGSLRVRLAEARVAGRAFEDGLLEGSLDRDRLAVEIHRLRGPGGRVEGRLVADLSGQWTSPGFESADGTLRFEALDLAALAGDAAPASDLAGSLDARLEDGVLSGTLALGPSRLGEAALSEAVVDGRATLATGAFEVERARLVSEFADVRVAHAAGDPGGLTSLHVERAEVDLAAVPAPWRPEPPLRGRVELEADLDLERGELRGPFALEASGVGPEEPADDPLLVDLRAAGRVLSRTSLRLERLSLAPRERPGLAVEAVSAFTASLRDDAVIVDGAVLRVAGGTLALDGGASTERLRDLRVRAEGLELATLLAALAPEEPAAAGRIDAALRLDGPRASPTVEGTLAWREPRVDGLAADAITASIEPVPPAGGAPVHAVRVRLERDGREALVARVRVPTRGILEEPARVLESVELRGSLELASFDTQWLAPLLPEDTPEIGGTLAGQLDVAGPLATPRVTGELVWSDPRLGERTAERVAVEIDAADGEGPLRLRARMVREGRDALRAELALRDPAQLADPAAVLDSEQTRLDVTFDDFDLGWVAPAGEEDGPRVEGRLEGEVRITGGAPVPTAEGAVRIRDLTVAGAPLPAAIGPASARLVFEEGRARLTTLRLPSGEGEARLRGALAWSDGATPEDPRLDLQLALSAFRIDQPGVLVGEVDGDVSVEGRVSALRAQGGLVLHDADLELPDTEDPLVREIQVHGLPEADEPPSIFEGEDGGAFDALQADVSLTIGDDVWLRGLGAELELDGDLRVRKSAGEEPGLFGSVRVVDGRVLFRGKRLRVTQGTAAFDGRPDPDPLLDATAVHQVRDVTIYVHLSGRASDLQVELSSDPAMSRENQLAYLLFDQPLGELGSDEQSQLGAAVGMLATDVVFGEVGAEVARAVGVDRVGIGFDEDRSPTLEVEKQILEDVTVRYGRSLAVDGGDRFVIEWRVFRNVFLLGEHSTEGASGVDALWRLEF